MVSTDAFNWDDEIIEDSVETEKTPAKTVEEKGQEKKEEEEEEEEEEELTEAEKAEKAQKDLLDNAFAEFTDAEEEEEEEEESAKVSTLKKKFIESHGFSEDDFTDIDDKDADADDKIIEKVIDTKVEEVLKSFTEGLDDDGKYFLKLKQQGVSTKEIMKLIAEEVAVPDYVSSDDKSAERFLKYYYDTHEDMDDEEIEDKIQWLKDRNSIHKYAEKFNTQVLAQIEAEKTKIENDTLKRKEALEKETIEYQKEMVSLIKEVENVNGYAITPNDKKLLSDFIFKRTVKVGDNKYTTKMNQKLSQLVTSKEKPDKEKFLLLATLLMKDFDFSKIEESLKSKVTKEVKKVVKENNSHKRKSASKSNSTKSLIDYF